MMTLKPHTGESRRCSNCRKEDPEGTSDLTIAGVGAALCRRCLNELHHLTAPAVECKACARRCAAGFEGQCPACAKDRVRAETAAERAARAVVARTVPDVSALVLDSGTAGSLAALGAQGDRGCPACKLVAIDGDELVVDARDRYWHTRCASETLSAHTRRDEERTAAHYTWSFDQVPLQFPKRM